MDVERTAYLGLGSNLGDKEENIKKTLNILAKKPGIALLKYSSVYLTKPLGVSRQPDFYNCAVQIKTSLFPQSLLKAVKLIELALGREPETHFQPRPMDIDILLYGNLEVNTIDLMIPHSRLTTRAFVLVPLLEINPELVHPISFKPLKEYLEEIDPPQNVERIIDAGELLQSAEED